MSTTTQTQPELFLDGLSNSASRRLVAALQALSLGRTAEAGNRLQGLLAVYPDHPEVLRMYAGLQSMQGDAVGARETMQRAIAMRPNDVAYWSSLGSVLIDNAEYDEAIKALRRACELDPGYTTAWYNLGLSLVRSMRTEEAETALNRAISQSPEESVNARAILGDMLRAEGRVDEAIAQYRAILASQPNAGSAWWGLADIKTQRFANEDLERLRHAMQIPGTGEDDLAAMGFTLAKALDDRGLYAESLAAIAQANGRIRARKIWDASSHKAYIDNVLQNFTPPPAGAADALGKGVIFIVSMPRSGSTLVEQVLASHSQVDGGGELSDLPSVLTQEWQRTGQPFPQFVRTLTPQDWERMGHTYLERTARWRSDRGYFTDKMPSNWIFVGAIRAMLPGARTIIVRRDPLETCLSCYRQRFANSEYTRTFADVASAWHDFDRAAKRWRQLYPGQVYESIYEELVVDPETKIRALLEFCDLPFEQACLEFHKTERKVHTPSATQVREPMRRDTARSHRYGALLDPLRAALGMPPFSDAA